jgi:hypothetical protein
MFARWHSHDRLGWGDQCVKKLVFCVQETKQVRFQKRGRGLGSSMTVHGRMC